jgi:group II intron reverse transcriptase/maturase
VGEIVAHICEEQALLDAWDRVRDNAYERGDPGPGVLAFEKGALRRLAALGAELSNGTWRPDPVVRVEIPKSAGGVRELGVGSIEDRVVEQAVLAELDPLVDPVLSPWSCAYRQGMGVKDAIRALVVGRDSGLFWVARADFEDCFDSIPRWPVLDRLRELTRDAELVTLVGRLMNRPVAGPVQPPARAGGLGLHQGSALSPLMANLYLDLFDRQMIAQGHQVVRYSDDFAIPAIGRATAERALELARAAAASLRLRLNERKCRVLSVDEGVPFLGQDGNRHHRRGGRAARASVAGNSVRHHRRRAPAHQGRAVTG